MPVLEVGATKIVYRVRRSKVAKRKSVIVTPQFVEVVVPPNEEEASVVAFVHEMRRWIYDRVEIMAQRRVSESPFPVRLATGAKVRYRGRRLRLVVELADVSGPEVRYRNAFHVVAPKGLTEDARQRVVQEALSEWMKTMVQRDAEWFARRYSKRLGVEPKGVRVKVQKHLWGSCGTDGVIRLNWHLAFVPKPVLEYVVVHELCHLRHRDHSPEFWGMVQRALPEYAEPKRWLDKYAA